MDSNKKEKMEEIPLEEKKEPDADAKSQVSTLNGQGHEIRIAL